MKLVGILFITLALMFGCAGYNVLPVSDLKAEYYRTDYWGETGTQERDGVEFIGRNWKTYRWYPETDLKIVLEELNNNDDYEVSLLWLSNSAQVLGACFNVISRETDTNIDHCGVFEFGSNEDMWYFVNEFEGTGDNVIDLIIWSEAMNAEEYMSELMDQIEDSRDTVLGED